MPRRLVDYSTIKRSSRQVIASRLNYNRIIVCYNNRLFNKLRLIVSSLDYSVLKNQYRKAPEAHSDPLRPAVYGFNYYHLYTNSKVVLNLTRLIRLMSLLKLIGLLRLLRLMRLN